MQYAEFEKSLKKAYKEFTRENNLCDIEFNDDLIVNGMDSLGYIRFIIYLEEIYGVTFDETFFLLEKMNSLDKLAGYMWELLEKAKAE